jgi:APA family basic amino acid/polyamine antiporter
LAVVAVFVLRRRQPNAVRPYRTWGYPVVPVVFLVFYAFLLVTMLLENPGHRLVGLGLISIGAIVYFLFAKRPELPQQGGISQQVPA